MLVAAADGEGIHIIPDPRLAEGAHKSRSLQIGEHILIPIRVGVLVSDKGLNPVVREIGDLINGLPLEFCDGR